MAYSHETKKRLAGMNLPESRLVRRTLQDYLNRSQLTVADFARRINYSAIAVAKFLCGTYTRISGNDLNIRYAIVDFIERHPLGQAEAPDGRVYETENVRILRHYFHDALDHRRALYLEGAPGTQKSFVLQHLIAELNRNELSKNGHGRRAYYVYCPANVTPNQLLKLIAQATGAISAGDNQRLVRNLRFDFRDRAALLVFDEAQHLSVACLETVRELYDLPPHFALMFAGSHQLEAFFTRNSLQLEQWNSRFHAAKTLPGMSRDEASGICRAEVPGLGEKKIAAIVEGSYALSLGSKGEKRYISARRLFEAIAKIKDELRRRAEGATA